MLEAFVWFCDAREIRWCKGKGVPQSLCLFLGWCVIKFFDFTLLAIKRLMDWSLESAISLRLCGHWFMMKFYVVYIKVGFLNHDSSKRKRNFKRTAWKVLRNFNAKSKYLKPSLTHILPLRISCVIGIHKQLKGKCQDIKFLNWTTFTLIWQLSFKLCSRIFIVCFWQTF